MSEFIFAQKFSRRDFLKKGIKGGATIALAPTILDLIFSQSTLAQIQRSDYLLDPSTINKLLEIALSRGGEFADIFVEYNIVNGVTLEENKIRKAECGISKGVGIRVISKEKTGYAYSDDFSFESLKKTADVAYYIAGNAQIGELPGVNVSPQKSPDVSRINLYPNEVEVKKKADLLLRANQTAFQQDPRVIQVIASFWDTTKSITVANSEGVMIDDQQVMSRLNVSVYAEDKNLRQTGYHGGGGRIGFDFFDRFTPEEVAKESTRQAITKLDAVEAPAGPQVVVLGNGWAGILLHESIGHGLEADFNRKGTSLYTGRIGQKVASELCTVIDEGNIPNKRGSIDIDDEGELTGKNVLIEKGVLRNYMFDKLNAKLMGTKSTGNGRRESYKHYPQPRMTNTYMLPGEASPEDILKSVKKGFYAKGVGGGQVDISKGNFVFEVTEGYLIEDGKITAPVRGANLIGIGPQVLEKVEMVGNDLELDPGIGSCGKGGQTVPVGVGLPTCKISEITVGGTQVKGKMAKTYLGSPDYYHV